MYYRADATWAGALDGARLVLHLRPMAMRYAPWRCVHLCCIIKQACRFEICLYDLGIAAETSASFLPAVLPLPVFNRWRLSSQGATAPVLDAHKSTHPPSTIRPSSLDRHPAPQQSS